MILTCPDCSTRYTVDAKTLGQSGRDVRCASCNHKWFAAPEPEEAEAVQEESAAPPEETNEDIVDTRQDSDETNLSTATTEDDEAVEDSAVLDEPAKTTKPKPAHRAYRDKLEAKARRKLKIIALSAWLGVAASLVLIAVLAIFNKEAVVRTLPRTAEVFAALGMPVSVWGVELKNKQVIRETINGEVVLRISGELYNPGNKTRSVPLIRISMQDEKGDEIHSWTTPTGLSELAAKTSTNFTTEVRNLPPQAVGLSFFFTDTSLETDVPQTGQKQVSEQHH